MTDLFYEGRKVIRVDISKLGEKFVNFKLTVEGNHGLYTVDLGYFKEQV